MEDRILPGDAAFHLPFSIFHPRFLLIIAFAIIMAGCTPPGPRALLKGKKLLDRGDYAGAVEQLKTATKILPGNAQAWNYLGVAQQHAGQSSDAMVSYERALVLDRDLVETHYNLGCLYLEQNKLADAKTEFTAYTLHRGNDATGWAKLGTAQLRNGELVPAEKSFGIAYGLETNNAEALNGLGLARVQRNRPKEAAQFFAAAIQYHPDYAPAILNLAMVSAEYLRDNKTALEYYRKYLALTPKPANWDEVNALANNLEQPAQVAAASFPPPSQPTQPTQAAPQTVAETKPQPANTAHVAATKPSPPPSKANSASRSSPPPQTVHTQTPTAVQLNAASLAANEKPTVAARLNSSRQQPPLMKYTDNGVTPLQTEPPEVVVVPQTQPKPAPPTFPRYHYLSPSKPKTGNHNAAIAAFNQARDYEKGSRWREAADAYEKATKADPAWFEAQYNLGVIAGRARNLSQSLAAYEMALAIQPDSVDARYNFALALKGAGYCFDAVNELKRIVAKNPNDVRAHLALGNLYAQQLQDNAQAREHYLKVLQIDPHNPEATDIGFWLAKNPQ